VTHCRLDYPQWNAQVVGKCGFTFWAMMENRLDLDFGHDLIDNGTSDDYYTPPFVFEALGIEFDMDVCAPAGGVPWIPAKESLSIIEDGLTTSWNGRIWCNPPYSYPAPWINKFIAHGNGVCLVQSSRANWWIRLWNEADAFAALPSNIKFVTGAGDSKGIFMPVVLVAMGALNVSALENSGLGRIR
jgi:hypothetical protein